MGAHSEGPKESLKRPFSAFVKTKILSLICDIQAFNTKIGFEVTSTSPIFILRGPLEHESLTNKLVFVPNWEGK